jgi:hypothetical protein
MTPGVERCHCKAIITLPTGQVYYQPTIYPVTLGHQYSQPVDVASGRVTVMSYGGQSGSVIVTAPALQ